MAPLLLTLVFRTRIGRTTMESYFTCRLEWYHCIWFYIHFVKVRKILPILSKIQCEISWYKVWDYSIFRFNTESAHHIEAWSDFESRARYHALELGGMSPKPMPSHLVTSTTQLFGVLECGVLVLPMTIRIYRVGSHNFDASTAIVPKTSAPAKRICNTSMTTSCVDYFVLLHQ